MKRFTDSSHCESRAHCRACRNDAAFRKTIFDAGRSDVPDFDCPLGFAIGQTAGLPEIVPRGTILPRHQWPLWAQSLAALAKPNEKGVGDVVERLIGKSTSSDFQNWYARIFGKPCNCQRRHDEWNKLYPL